MSRETTIELFKEDMKFSAGHFTVFSPTRRENLHGHNFNVYVSLTCMVPADGIVFDYRLYKTKIREVCQQWNEIVLLPGHCPYLKIDQSRDDVVTATFDDETLTFLRRDALVLPIANVTVEELAGLVLGEILGVRQPEDRQSISAIRVKVFSGPGQCGSADWIAA